MLLHRQRGRKEAAGREQIEKTLDGVQGDDDIIVKKRVLVGADPVQTIVEESANYDLLLIGASHRNWLGRIRRGSMVARIVRNCNPTSIVVSARRSRIGSWLGRLFT